MTLQDRINRIRSQPAPPNEESAKAAVILPILGDLGWASDNPSRVFFEYTAGGGRVDIALKDRGRSVAFLEAKAPGKKLESHVSQLLAYAFHEGVDVCVLTTGFEWWLYLPREKGPPLDRRFATLNLLSDPVDKSAELLHKYLGRRELANQSAETNAKAALQSLRTQKKLKIAIPRIWKKMKTDPDHELIDLIGKRVREQTDLDPKPADIATALGITEPPPKPVKPEPKPTKKRKNSPPTAFTLWGRRMPIDTHRKLLTGVFTAVQGRHESGFLAAVRPLWGSHRPWVSADPSDLRTALAIKGSEWYVDANLNAKTIETRCRRLLAAFGYANSDLEIHFA